MLYSDILVTRSGRITSSRSINHSGDGAWLDFHHAFGTHVVLDAKAIDAATKEVLATYGVTRDRSNDLDGI